MIDGAQLRALREQAGMRLQDLASAVDCSVGHLKNIETSTDERRKRHQPSPAMAHRLLRVLSLRLDRSVSLGEISAAPETEAAA